MLNNRGEAIDYLMESGLKDATIGEIMLKGFTAWAVTSSMFPADLGDDIHHYLLPDGKIIGVDVHNPNIQEAYEAQFGRSFPWKKEVEAQ